MANPADDADMGANIGGTTIMFIPLQDSKVRTRKPLELAIWDPKDGKGYIAEHALPVEAETLRFQAGNQQARGTTEEEAAQNLFKGLQRRLYEIRTKTIAPDLTGKIQRGYLEAVLDMPEGYNPDA